MDRRLLTSIWVILLGAMVFILVPNHGDRPASTWNDRLEQKEADSAAAQAGENLKDENLAATQPGRRIIQPVLPEMDPAYLASLPLFPSFVGTLVLPSGNPARQIEISAFGLRGNAFFISDHDSRTKPLITWSTTTDFRGRFHFPEAPRDGLRFLIQAKHAKYPFLEVTNQPAGPGQTKDLGTLQFQSEVILKGRVLDENGSPVANARIAAHREPISSIVGVYQAHDLPPLPDCAATTDNNGEFEINKLPSGRLRISAQAEGFLETFSGPVEVKAGDAVDTLLLEMPRGKPLVGQVVSQSGEWVSEASVQLEWSSSDSPVGESGEVTTQTGPQGHFHLDFPPGLVRARLTVVAPSWWILVERIRGVEFEEFLKLELEAMPPLQGLVTDPDGNPVAQADVGLFELHQVRDRSMDPSLAPALVTTQSDEFGRFELQASLEGIAASRYRLGAWHQQHGAAYSNSIRLDRGPDRVPKELKIRLELAAPIFGTVFFPNGEVAKNAPVNLRRLYRRSGNNTSWGVPSSRTPGQIYRRTSTNGEGQFEFTAIPPSLWRIEAYAAGTAAGQSEDFETKDGISHEVDVYLPAPAILKGQILGDISGFHGLRILARSPETDEQETRVLKDGSFIFQRLSPANYEIRTREIDVWTESNFGSFTLDDSLTPVKDVELASGEEAHIELELMLEGRGSLEGMVFHNGEPASNFGVSLFPVDSESYIPSARINNLRMDLGNFRSARTDFRGHYRLEGVLSGEYWVVVTRNGGFPGSPWDNRRAEEGPKGLVRVQIDLPPGEPQQKEFYVYTGGVDCLVMIPEGKGSRPIRGGYAQFKPFDSQSGVETKWVRISRTGRIRTEFLPVGEWTLNLDAGDYRLKNIPVTISNRSILEEEFLLKKKPTEKE
jgi:hypothetical protein